MCPFRVAPHSRNRHRRSYAAHVPPKTAKGLDEAFAPTPLMLRTSTPRSLGELVGSRRTRAEPMYRITGPRLHIQVRRRRLLPRVSDCDNEVVPGSPARCRLADAATPQASAS